MPESGDKMLFGDGIGKISIASTISNNKKQQPHIINNSPKSARKRSRAKSAAKTMNVTSSRKVVPSRLSPALNLASHDQLRTPPESSQPAEIILPPGKRDRHWVIARIEDVFEQQIDSITANEGHLSISVRMRSGDTSTIRKLQFPGTSEKDAWRYTVVIRILELIHEALVTESIITKRDIYYRDPTLFSTQAVVDRYVDNLACTFGVSRLILNVVATAKGLIAGCFKIRRHDGTVVDGTSEREGILISRLGADDTVDVNHVQWVLVVEKEATFRSLVSSDLWKNLLSHGILLTAKGYPDIATRTLLRLLALPSKPNNHKTLPVHALMDYDPDGIDILSTYKHGSRALAHETANLELTSIQWLGLHSGELGQQQDLHQTQGLLNLSARDRRKASRMLEREPFVEGGKEAQWRRELQVMLFLNVKAEIQVLEAQERGLIRWLNGKGIE